MDGSRFDTLSRTLAARTDRRTALRRGGALGLAAGLLGAAGRRAAAQEATPEIPSDAPCVFPFAASVRQGPSAGATLVGYLTLATDPTGATKGTFYTHDDQLIGVSGQLSGQAVNLVFTPADGVYIFGVGTATTALATCHGQFNAPMGGPLVGPAEGDLGDWAVIIDYGDALEGNITPLPGSTLEFAKANRSPMCRACVQGCKNSGTTDVNTCTYICDQANQGPCGCGDRGFEYLC